MACFLGFFVFFGEFVVYWDKFIGGFVEAESGAVIQGFLFGWIIGLAQIRFCGEGHVFIAIFCVGDGEIASGAYLIAVVVGGLIILCDSSGKCVAIGEFLWKMDRRAVFFLQFQGLLVGMHFIVSAAV